jgi:hypothetical protein
MTAEAIEITQEGWRTLDRPDGTDRRQSVNRQQGVCDARQALKASDRHGGAAYRAGATEHRRLRGWRGSEAPPTNFEPIAAEPIGRILAALLAIDRGINIGLLRRSSINPWRMTTSVIGYWVCVESDNRAPCA